MKTSGLSFSRESTLGITQAKQHFSRKSGIPASRAGIERKIEKVIIKGILVK